MTDCCVHVTNFAVNVKNESNKFVYNETPSECFGNKVPYSSVSSTYVRTIKLVICFTSRAAANSYIDVGHPKDELKDMDNGHITQFSD